MVVVDVAGSGGHLIGVVVKGRIVITVVVVVVYVAGSEPKNI